MGISILFLGQQWLGSDARGLASAFRALGNVTDIVDENTYVPKVNSFQAKLWRKLGRKSFEREYNAEILTRDDLLNPHLVVVFKGESVWRETLQELKRRGRIVYLFFPDVSLFVHGKNIPQCVPLYDEIFTTKSFGPADLKEHFGVINSHVIAHGFDPELHKPIPVIESLWPRIECDISFIGTWSLKKETILSALVAANVTNKIFIWGAQWERCKSPGLFPYIRYRGVLGDMYVACISASRINLAILSEARPGASSGDQVTSRTFQIPASGGFMLHERTQELLQYYHEPTEVACFGSQEELIEKAGYYLTNECERKNVQQRGYVRCLREHGLIQRARTMLTVYEERKAARPLGVQN